MRIVFGWNSFLIRSFTTKELGIPSDESTKLTIERRQKYFHLFWIPFFGIGKIWVVRKEGGLYELPIQFESHIESLNLELKTPWYTFAGPLLILVGTLFYLISSSIDDHRWKVQSEENFKKELSELQKVTTAPTTSDYFYFHERNSSSQDVYLKVAEVNDTAVRFQLPMAAPKSYSNSPSAIAACFTDDPKRMVDFWMNKKRLAQYINTLQDDYKFEGYGLPYLDTSFRFVLKQVYHLEGPDFTDTGSGTVYNNRISIKLLNKGLGATITNLKKLSGDVDWNIELPMKVASDEEFTLLGTYTKDDPDYKLEITCLDINKKTTIFILEGKGFERNIKKKVE